MRDCNGGDQGSDKSDKWGKEEVEEIVKTQNEQDLVTDLIPGMKNRYLAQTER